MWMWVSWTTRQAEVGWRIPKMNWWSHCWTLFLATLVLMFTLIYLLLFTPAGSKPAQNWASPTVPHTQANWKLLLPPLCQSTWQPHILCLWLAQSGCDAGTELWQPSCARGSCQPIAIRKLLHQLIIYAASTHISTPERADAFRTWCVFGGGGCVPTRWDWRNTLPSVPPGGRRAAVHPAWGNLLTISELQPGVQPAFSTTV